MSTAVLVPAAPAAPLILPPASVTSQVIVLGTLGPFDPHLLSREVPLFAAAAPVAHERGGHLTRAFLNGLPADWQGDHLVMESMLVWLQVGRSLPTRWFHHEVFPRDHALAFGAANRERGVEHIAWSWRAQSSREFLVGDPDPVAGLAGDGAPLDLYETKEADFGRRHDHLRRLRDEGQPPSPHRCRARSRNPRGI